MLCVSGKTAMVCALCGCWGGSGSEALSGVEMVEYMRVKLERGLGMTRNKHGCAVGKNMA